MAHEATPIYDKQGNFTGTKDSQDLCERMLDETGGEVMLAFSRGKDSLAAWLYLLENGFTTIHPFTMEAIPGLEYVEKSVVYYEKWFDTKITRVIQGENLASILSLFYQPIEDEQLIDKLNLWPYKIWDVAPILAEEAGLDENFWLAQGFSMYDTVDRVTWVGNGRGIRTNHGVNEFFPCWDWKPSWVQNYIQQFDISLSLDYLLDKLSLEGIPLPTTLFHMKNTFYEDYQRVKLFFPFIDARLARNEFRIRKLEKQQRERENR